MKPRTRIFAVASFCAVILSGLISSGVSLSSARVVALPKDVGGAARKPTTRDFVDFAELSRLLERDEVVDALSVLDEKFGWARQPSIILEVTKALLQPEPHDRGTNGFETLRFLDPKLKTWEEVAAQCRDIGQRLAIRTLGGDSDAT